MEDKEKELAIAEPIESAHESAEEKDAPEKETQAAESSEKDNKIFKKYKIKDIVFLAIITACTLVTGAVMPLLVNVPLFGIIQLG